MSYTRLTVIGSDRKAELALPNTEPVGVLLPHVLELLEERPRGGEVLALTTLTGASLDFDASLDEQGVRPGALLRVSTVDDAPQAPEVIDVTDAIADAGALRRDAWSPALTRAVLLVAVGVAAAGSAMWAMPAFSIRAGLMLAGVVLLAAVGALLARAGRTAAAGGFAAAAIGVAVPAAVRYGGGQIGGEQLPTVVLVAAGAAWLVLGVVWGFGFARKSALYGAAAGLASSGALLALSLLGVDRGGVAIVAAVLSVAVLGVLPGLALSLSGLTSYDDRIMRGERASSRDVRGAIAESFAQLTWTVVAAAIVAVISLAELLLSQDPWRQGLAAALALVALLRVRTFPLLQPRLALLLAVATLAILWLTSTTLIGDPVKALLVALVAALLVAAAAWTPSEVVAARLRRAADIVELLLVLTVVPLALGAFGIFADLLQAFR